MVNGFGEARRIEARRAKVGDPNGLERGVEFPPVRGSGGAL